MPVELNEDQIQIRNMIQRFVEKEIVPVASELEHADAYPHEIVEKMKELGLFGSLIPTDHGGMGLDITSYALIIEEISKGWMSIAGILNSHVIMAYDVSQSGPEEIKRKYLMQMATGEKRGGIMLTEPNCGSDLQAIRTTAVKYGDFYILNGVKTFATNARWGNTFLVLAKTDPAALPPYRGISLFVAEKPGPLGGSGGDGFTVSRDIGKLGYKGLKTCEVALENFRVPAENLVGGVEGKGFGQIMSGLEVGRINVAARAVGVAQAAFLESIRYAQQRDAFGKPIIKHQAIQFKLADMATRIEAARLLTYSAAAMKDRGERCDLEAGMAKLFASEACQWIVTEAMVIHGAYGYADEFNLERYYRDAPLMVIGEGTNEIQRMIIARGLLEQYKI
ncbi:MAG: acyl-CoA dehydrogenase family protein [Deltaproteobacteria bacterium]|nr:acyl-CoA dehydrogenase family protein [Deltaproteobacteria bacterium]MBW2309203.1 acyl-CoA dehydrogenase family protein [Deltaproteobacteria bacterium]